MRRDYPPDLPISLVSTASVFLLTSAMNLRHLTMLVQYKTAPSAWLYGRRLSAGNLLHVPLIHTRAESVLLNCQSGDWVIGIAPN